MRQSSSRFVSAGLVLTCAATMLLTGCSHSDRSSDEPFGDSMSATFTSDTGALHINKMGGDIDVDDAPNGAELHTMGGNVVVGNAAKSLTAKTMGGNISVHSADVVDLNATTMGGNINIDSVKAAVLKATTMGGNVTVQALSDGSIELKSMGGNINLTIPKSASARIDLELEYNALSGPRYTITDNLNLQQQQSSTWEMWRFTHRYRVSAQGAIGSGNNRIHIKAFGGNITLNAQ
jgi:Putative adhesin